MIPSTYQLQAIDSATHPHPGVAAEIAAARARGDTVPRPPDRRRLRTWLKRLLHRDIRPDAWSGVPAE